MSTFSRLISWLEVEVESVREILTIGDGLRELLLTHADHLSGLGDAQPPLGDKNAIVTYGLSRMLPRGPDKLDWQIYDHCAALTRLYALYERFVRELVSEYVTLLPGIYEKYADLPHPVTIQHRLGIGQILLRLGDKGRYKTLEEEKIIRQLATGLGGALGYTLLPDAFFTDFQNLRFEVLMRMFSSLGFEHPGGFINKHPAVADFIRTECPEGSTAEKELGDFIEYRNEAAHRMVDNVLSVDAIAGIGRFILALANALADLVDEGILRRRIHLGQFSEVLNVAETHYGGYVAVGTLNPATLKVGDGLVVFQGSTCSRALVESIQVNGQPAESISSDGAIEVGLKLNRRTRKGSRLCRVQLPDSGPAEVQLQLEGMSEVPAEAADTDLADLDATESLSEAEEPDPLT